MLHLYQLMMSSKLRHENITRVTLQTCAGLHVVLQGGQMSLSVSLAGMMGPGGERSQQLPGAHLLQQTSQLCNSARPQYCVLACHTAQGRHAL